MIKKWLWDPVDSNTASLCHYRLDPTVINTIDNGLEALCYNENCTATMIQNFSFDWEIEEESKIFDIDGKVCISDRHVI